MENNYLEERVSELEGKLTTINLDAQSLIKLDNESVITKGFIENLTEKLASGLKITNEKITIFAPRITLDGEVVKDKRLKSGDCYGMDTDKYKIKVTPREKDVVLEYRNLSNTRKETFILSKLSKEEK